MPDAALQPAPLTPFIGRESDLRAVNAYLADPECRLLTVTGPGGIGKTRLALEAARLAAHEGEMGWPRQVFFISLAAVDQPKRVPLVIAEALKITLGGRDTPLDQLCQHLAGRSALLVLDNLEQLAEAAPLLSHILAAAPQVQMLVTSRTALQLEEERLYPLVGLPYPEQADSPDLLKYPAVQLFVERARRVRGDLAIEAEAGGILQICRLVEGMPLALELAATWARALDSAEIAAEINRSLDFLATRLRNIPERHRSLQVVFEQSWQLLEAGEQEAFKRLAVFRGSFDRQAAAQVAAASLQTLSTLVDHSLLRREPGGRYTIHELLRLYALERLAEIKLDWEEAHQRHSAFFTGFLDGRRVDVVSSRQREALAEIDSELENINAAWEWSIAHADTVAIQRLIFPFYQFNDSRGRYYETIEVFEHAVSALQTGAAEENKEAIALALSFLGGSYLRVGRLDEARRAFERSQGLLEATGRLPPPDFGSDPLLGLGILANVYGDYPEAARLGELTRARHEARADLYNLQISYYILANAFLAQGEIEKSWVHSRQAYRLAEQTNNRWFIAYILSDLGNAACALGDYAQARQHFQAGYDLKSQLGDPEGMAAALNCLGKVASLSGEITAAINYYRQGLEIYEQIRDLGGLARSCEGLGDMHLALGDLNIAKRHFLRALQIAEEMQFTPLLLSILVGVGNLWLRSGEAQRGKRLIRLAQAHPASSAETRARALALLAADTVGITCELEMADLDALVAETVDELASPPRPTPGVAAAGELIEPLTNREMEVLQLLGHGLSNPEIAARLVLALGTVKFYTGQIYAKLGVSSRTKALLRARQLGLIV